MSFFPSTGADSSGGISSPSALFRSGKDKTRRRLRKESSQEAHGTLFGRKVQAFTKAEEYGGLKRGQRR